MAEPRPLASLTAGLLARKGQASPAIRPSFAPRIAEPRAAPERPAVVVQQQRLASVFAAPAEGKAKRIALTLRLDEDRHLKLKLLSARRRNSIQAMLLDVLDDMLLESGSDDCVCGAAE